MAGITSLMRNPNYFLQHPTTMSDLTSSFDYVVVTAAWGYGQFSIIIDRFGRKFIGVAGSRSKLPENVNISISIMGGRIDCDHSDANIVGAAIDNFIIGWSRSGIIGAGGAFAVTQSGDTKSFEIGFSTPQIGYSGGIADELHTILEAIGRNAIQGNSISITDYQILYPPYGQVNKPTTFTADIDTYVGKNTYAAKNIDDTASRPSVLAAKSDNNLYTVTIIAQEGADFTAVAQVIPELAQQYPTDYAKVYDAGKSFTVTVADAKRFGEIEQSQNKLKNVTVIGTAQGGLVSHATLYCSGKITPNSVAEIQENGVKLLSDFENQPADKSFIIFKFTDNPTPSVNLTNTSSSSAPTSPPTTFEQRWQYNFQTILGPTNPAFIDATLNSAEDFNYFTLEYNPNGVLWRINAAGLPHPYDDNNFVEQNRVINTTTTQTITEMKGSGDFTRISSDLA